MEISWSEFKAIVTNRCLSIQYVTVNGNYWLKAIDGYFEVECMLPIGVNNSDTNDFETNFKAAGNKSFSDIDGTPVARVKATKKGWIYGMIPVEFQTAKLNSLDSKLVDGTTRSGFTYKIYDANDTEITTVLGEINAVKTVIDFEPTYDYEIIGGQMQQLSKPATDIHVWVIAAPDIPANYGGSKEMVGGVDLKFLDPADKLNADGRVSKLIPYDPVYHSGKLRLVLKHDAGVQHALLLVLEIFRA